MSETPDLSGNWVIFADGQRYGLRIQQTGLDVKGSYGLHQGTIGGYFDGKTLTLKWDQPGNRVGGDSQMEADNDLEFLKGKWSCDPRRYDSGRTDQGEWEFRRNTSEPSEHPVMQRVIKSLVHNQWRPDIVPGSNAAWSKSKLMETYFIAFVYRPSGSRGYDAQSAVDSLLKWLQAHTPYHTQAMLAVVFDGVPLDEAQAIARAGAVGNYQQAHAGVVDLKSECFSGFNGFGWLMEETGLKSAAL
jgi:hypothetical protein